MPNLVGLTAAQALWALVAVYPESHPQGNDGSDSTATAVSQEPAAGTALDPEDGVVTEHMSDAASNPQPTAEAMPPDTGSVGDTGSGSSGGHHYIPHPRSTSTGTY